MKEIIFAILLILFILAFIADNFLGMTNVAKAEPLHDNAYYCQQWKEGEMVMGADSKQMQELCDNLK